MRALRCLVAFFFFFLVADGRVRGEQGSAVKGALDVVPLLLVQRNEYSAVQISYLGVGFVDGIAENVQSGARNRVRCEVVGLELCE